MTAEELTRCLNSLPAEVRKRILEETTPAREYVARAARIREQLCHRFPNMHPKVRAVISLAAARIL
jgi:TRAP-type C4-dicarboxylate transport system substrate-binding protein